MDDRAFDYLIQVGFAGGWLLRTDASRINDVFVLRQSLVFRRSS